MNGGLHRKRILLVINEDLSLKWKYIHDSVAWDAVYDGVTGEYDCVTFVAMDAG